MYNWQDTKKVEVLDAGYKNRSVTNTLTKTELYKYTLPGGKFSQSDKLVIETFWSHTNSANLKTLAIEFGPAPNTLHTTNKTTTASTAHRNAMFAKGSMVQQIYLPHSSLVFGTTGGVYSTTNVDFTVDVDFFFMGTMAALAETITLESMSIELLKS